MPHEMWFPDRDVPGEAHPWIEMLGRASLVCQIFESHSRYVFRIADLATGFQSGEYSSLEEAWQADDFKAIDRMALHRAIGGLARLSESVERDLQTLLAAKDARNYFAHHAALPTFSTRAQSDEYERVQKESAALSEGFAIVSRWVFEIEEKDFVPRHVGEGHAERVCRWILEPVIEFENSDSTG